ncbi:RNA methyltransferase [Brevundimonas sp.]|uniref:TrmH family RNA methyltransferase n=1 Tax=Brevundimonas sp. TaxID=1871086 RepID=UPI0025D37373|nr:RNA methyltransferase [Brevundimonas sp.]
MRPIPITDPDDPRIAAFREVRERDLVGRQGRFVAEGEVVLRALLSAASRHEAEAVLIAESRWPKLADVLEASPTPVFTASQAVMDAITGFHIHRGILAVGRKAEPNAPGELLGGPRAGDIALAVVGVGNHDNMGGLFRAAAAFGARGVLLDPTSCDPLYRKAIRVSVGAALTTPFARLEPDADPARLLTDLGYAPLALSPDAGETLAEVRRTGPAAIIVGAEGPGLPDSLMARCRRVSIPMASGWDSLNVATAAAIALHHLRFGAHG